MFNPNNVGKRFAMKGEPLSKKVVEYSNTYLRKSPRRLSIQEDFEKKMEEKIGPKPIEPHNVVYQDPYLKPRQELYKVMMGKNYNNNESRKSSPQDLYLKELEKYEKEIQLWKKKKAQYLQEHKENIPSYYVYENTNFGRTDNIRRNSTKRVQRLQNVNSRNNIKRTKINISGTGNGSSSSNNNVGTTESVKIKNLQDEAVKCKKELQNCRDSLDLAMKDCNSKISQLETQHKNKIDSIRYNLNKEIVRLQDDNTLINEVNTENEFKLNQVSEESDELQRLFDNAQKEIKSLKISLQKSLKQLERYKDIRPPGNIYNSGNNANNENNGNNGNSSNSKKEAERLKAKEKAERIEQKKISNAMAAALNKEYDNGNGNDNPINWN